MVPANMSLLFDIQRLLLLFALIQGFVVEKVYSGIGLKPLDFFRFNEEELAKDIKIEFHPGDGLKLREKFEKKYGIRGEVLIRSLGEGLTPADNDPKSQ